MGIFDWLFPKRVVPPASARTLGRNEPCWCGSGEKYKACHFDQDRVYFARVAAAYEAACRGPS